MQVSGSTSLSPRILLLLLLSQCRTPCARVQHQTKQQHKLQQEQQQKWKQRQKQTQKQKQKQTQKQTQKLKQKARHAICTCTANPCSMHTLRRELMTHSESCRSMQLPQLLLCHKPTAGGRCGAGLPSGHLHSTANA